MTERIVMGFSHPKHGKCFIEMEGDLAMIGWIGRALEESLRHDAHPANPPIKPYPMRDMLRLARGELKT